MLNLKIKLCVTFAKTSGEWCEIYSVMLVEYQIPGRRTGRRKNRLGKITACTRV